MQGFADNKTAGSPRVFLRDKNFKSMCKDRFAQLIGGFKKTPAKYFLEISKSSRDLRTCVFGGRNLSLKKNF